MKNLRPLLLLLALLASADRLMAQQQPPPSPTPVPAPSPERDSGGPFRPSEDVPVDAEVDFPGDI